MEQNFNKKIGKKLFVKIFAYSNSINIFSFLFVILLSRYLTKNDFSLITSLTSFGMGAAYLLSFFVPLLSNIISKNNKIDLRSFYTNSLFIFIFFFIILTFITYQCKDYFFEFYKFDNIKILIIFVTIVILNIFLYLQLGILNGLLEFKFHTRVQALQQVLRVILIIIFFTYFYKISLAIGATLISLFLTVIIFHFKIINSNLFAQTPKKKYLMNKLFNKERIIKSILFSLLVSFLIYHDISLSRYVLDYNKSSEFNIYSSLSKINYYLMIGIIHTLIPLNNIKNNELNKIFNKKAILITLAFFLMPNIFYFFYSDQFINIIFGYNVSNSHVYLLKINLSSLFFTLSIILLNYNYDKLSYKFYLCIFILIFIYLINLIFQDNLNIFINYILLFNIFLLLIMIFKKLKFND